MLNPVALVVLGHHVRAKSLGHIHGVRHRHDIIGGRCLQLVNEIDNTREFFDHIVDFVLVHAEPRERRRTLAATTGPV